MVDCQCTDCVDCPDYPGCDGTDGTPVTLGGTTILTDAKRGELTFEPARLPGCTTAPTLAAEEDPLTVHLTGLPTDVVGTVEVTVGDDVLATASTALIAPDGSISIATSLPAGATGSVLVSAGLQGLAPRTGCLVKVTPTLDCPDNDGDGDCDAADPDDDNDGVADGSDSDSTNRFVCRDVDADTCDDCSSGTDNTLVDGPDYDLDGICNDGDPDDDNDGVPDVNDLDPFNPNGCGDSDGDRCDDCIINAMPTPLDDGPDFESDGLCDFGDPDDDNDGTDDFEDCAPLDNTLRTAVGDVGLNFSSADRVIWDSAIFGTATTTDLVRGDSLPVGAGVEFCLEDDTTAAFHDDVSVPAVGFGFWYLARGDNACGAGDYGKDSAGTTRVTAVCP